MNFTDLEFGVAVVGFLLLAVAGVAWLHRDTLKAAWTDWRAPKLDEAFVKMHGEAIIRSFLDRLQPIEEKAAAAMTRANTAIKVATAKAVVVQPPTEASPAAMPPEPEGDDMDKGIVTAAQLLAGWVLPDFDVDPPVQGVLPRRHADLMYLLQMAKKPGGNNVFQDVVIGPVGLVPNYAHTIGLEASVDWNQDGTHKDWSADPNVTPAIKEAAEDSVKATLAGWAARGVKVPTYDFSRYYAKRA